MSCRLSFYSVLFRFFFFFNDTATTEIYTLSLHDALPICNLQHFGYGVKGFTLSMIETAIELSERSEEHTSELQSPMYLVCRLLLEKKKKKNYIFGRRSQHNMKKGYSV